MDADVITEITNNRVESVRPASEYPDIVRYVERSTYDDEGNKIGKEQVPVRFIVRYHINREGELVDNDDEIVGIVVEYKDEYKLQLMHMRGTRPTKIDKSCLPQKGASHD